jgi:hypothetical protein
MIVAGEKIRPDARESLPVIDPAAGAETHLSANFAV